MKQFLIILAFLTSLVMGAVLTIALPRAEKNIEILLDNFGFDKAEVKKSQFTLTGIEFDLIQLDKEGFSAIKNLKVTLFWPTYFMTRSIDKIEIGSLEISAMPRELGRFIKSAKGREALGTLPADYINIENIILDVAVAKKAVRFKGRLLIHKEADKKYKIAGNITAAQPEISLDTTLTGFVDTDAQSINLDGTIAEFNVASTTIDIKRGNGWFSYQSGEKKSFSAQMDAGSGAVFNIPAKNLSLVMGQEGLTYPILFRANAAGIDGVKLTCDLVYAPEMSSRNFDSTLQIQDMDGFLNNLKLQNIITKKPETKIKTLEAKFIYVPEKRFAGGPLPFDLSIKTKLQNDLSGTFLIYPDSLDMRGTAGGSQAVMDLLQSTFPLPAENVNGSNMRLDGNLKSLVD